MIKRGKKPAPESRRLRVPFAAEYLGIGVGTLNQMRVNGTGPKFIKIGGRDGKIVLYDTRDLDRWLELNKYSSTSELTKCAVR
jgi:hypothetical protein